MVGDRDIFFKSLIYKGGKGYEQDKEKEILEVTR